MINIYSLKETANEKEKDKLYDKLEENIIVVLQYFNAHIGMGDQNKEVT